MTKESPDAASRFSAIEAGRKKGQSVAEACRLLGVHRSLYYRWRRRGGELPPRTTVTQELRNRVLDLAAEFPSWGCDRIAYCLKLEGMPLSSPSVQKILVAEGLGKRREREARAARDLPQPRQDSEPFAEADGNGSAGAATARNAHRREGS